MKINLNYKKTVRIISMMCGLLFSIFGIVYLYVFQTDVLEAVHFSLAHGKTVFSPLGSSLIITFMLLVMSLLLSKFLNIKGIWQSVAYIPAFIALASFTDVRRGIYTADYSSYNLWLYSSLFLLSLLLLFLLRRFFARSVKRAMVYPSIYIVNVVCMILFTLLSVMGGTTDKLYHNELHAESCLRKGNNYDALMIARHSSETSRTLTALRALALSKEGLMGEKIFEYPQNYKSDGLLFSPDSLTTLRYSNDSVRAYLCVGDSTFRLNFVSQLRDFCQPDSCRKAVADYYLTGLLLDKHLDTFISLLPQYYPNGQYLPKHYREAVILGRSRNKAQGIELNDSVMDSRFEEYLADRERLRQEEFEYTLMKNKYGKTYWWYFDYQQ